MNYLEQNKLRAYAMATEDDIYATKFEQVRDGKLWSGWVGTVYMRKVQGGDKFGFDTFEDARQDAMLFVEKCAMLWSEKAKKGDV